MKTSDKKPTKPKTEASPELKKATAKASSKTILTDPKLKS
jgi:hypothetical protein